MQVTLDIPFVVRIGRFPFQFYRKVKRRLPDGWADVRLRHMEGLAEWFFAVAKKGSNDNPKALMEAAASLFCRWMKIPAVWALTDTVQAEPEVARIALRFIAGQAHDKPLSKGLLWMHGPGSKLIAMRYQQFIFAERIYENWVKEGGDVALRQLAAITLRCQWMPYSIKWAGWRYQLLRLAPRSVLLRAAFTYMGQRAHLPTLYPELYRSRGGKAPALKIDQVILNQCGAELGDFDKVAAAPVHRVLEFMQIKEIQAIKNNPEYARSSATVEDLYARAGYSKLPNWAK